MSSTELLAWSLRENPQAIIITLAETCDAKVVEKLPESVKVISTMAVGTDNIDKDACQRRDITVVNTPHVLTEATADLTWALILAASRRLFEGHRLSVDGQFQGWSPELLLGKELYGATLGIIGYGRIGKAVAARGKGFGMNVVYFNRSNKSGTARACANVDELCKVSDVISIHCPLNDESYHLLDKKRLRLCKRDAVLVNVSRGAVINEEELVGVLDDGWFLGVGLDVFEHEPKIHPKLKTFSRVILSPHLGSATVSTRRRMMEAAIEGALEGLRE